MQNVQYVQRPMTYVPGAHQQAAFQPQHGQIMGNIGHPNISGYVRPNLVAQYNALPQFPIQTNYPSQYMGPRASSSAGYAARSEKEAEGAVEATIDKAKRRKESSVEEEEGLMMESSEKGEQSEAEYLKSMRAKILERNRQAAIKSRQKKKEEMKKLAIDLEAKERHHDELMERLNQARKERDELRMNLFEHRSCSCDMIGTYEQLLRLHKRDDSALLNMIN
jgi:hypothetical protein